MDRIWQIRQIWQENLASLSAQLDLKSSISVLCSRYLTLMPIGQMWNRFTFLIKCIPMMKDLSIKAIQHQSLTFTKRYSYVRLMPSGSCINVFMIHLEAAGYQGYTLSSYYIKFTHLCTHVLKPCPG